MLRHVRVYLLLLTFPIWTVPTKAQEYKHGVGAQLNLFSFQETYTDITGLYNPIDNAVVPGLLYKASFGFNINKTRTIRLSATTYPFFGFNTNGGATSAVAFEVPLLAEFFFGDVDYFGGFIGVGGSYSYTAVTGFGDGVVIGPQVEGGLQFPVFERVIAVKLAYTYGLNNPSPSAFPNRTYTKNQRSLFSIGALYMFGY